MGWSALMSWKSESANSAQLIDQIGELLILAQGIQATSCIICKKMAVQLR
jgi:hypothetical protein